MVSEEICKCSFVRCYWVVVWQLECTIADEWMLDVQERTEQDQSISFRFEGSGEQSVESGEVKAGLLGIGASGNDDVQWPRRFGLLSNSVRV